MIGKLFGRSNGEEPKRKKDKAIIHQSVPDEVLYPEGRKVAEADTSWMDDVLGETAKPEPAATEPADAPAVRTPAPTARPNPAPAARRAPQPVMDRPAAAPVTIPAAAPNPRTSGRPRFPVGWLVMIEGDDVGEWVPLEGGVSTLGPDAGDTVAVTRGTASISFDAEQNAFALAPRNGSSVRLNGVAIEGAQRLRDGDVIGFEGTALKLVALCSGNFRWSDADKTG